MHAKSVIPRYVSVVILLGIVLAIAAVYGSNRRSASEPVEAPAPATMSTTTQKAHSDMSSPLLLQQPPLVVPEAATRTVETAPVSTSTAVSSTPTVPPPEVKESVAISPPHTSQVRPLTAFKFATTTVFWVGERPSRDNGYIANKASAWNEDWQGTYGGFDDPDDRCGYVPCAFMPSLSPFYIALPYSDIDDEGYLKENADRMPWFDPAGEAKRSQLEGKWVEVRHGTYVCYGEVRDVGPFETDDVDYVFGAAANPRTLMGERAGLDVSPAMRDCLSMGGVGRTLWRFIDPATVPPGPWRSWQTP